MEQQIALQWEALAAGLTGERPVAGVTARHVIYQVFLACEWLAADIAAMRIIA